MGAAPFAVCAKSASPSAPRQPTIRRCLAPLPCAVALRRCLAPLPCAVALRRCLAPLPCAVAFRRYAVILSAAPSRPVQGRSSRFEESLFVCPFPSGHTSTHGLSHRPAASSRVPHPSRFVRRVRPVPRAPPAIVSAAFSRPVPGRSSGVEGSAFAVAVAFAVASRPHPNPPRAPAVSRVECRPHPKPHPGSRNFLPSPVRSPVPPRESRYTSNQA